MGIYVIGDVHGYFSELKKMMNVIEQQDKDARYIFVGDLLDRGPENVEMVQWAIENIKPGRDEKYHSVCTEETKFLLKLQSKF